MFALRTPPTHRWTPAALLAAPVLALAACGTDAAPTASTGGPSTPSPASGSSSVETTGNANAARDAYDLELAQYMRGRGVDVKNPTRARGSRRGVPHQDRDAAH